MFKDKNVRTLSLVRLQKNKLMSQLMEYIHHLSSYFTSLSDPSKPQEEYYVDLPVR
jgi:hypothetical protein